MHFGQLRLGAFSVHLCLRLSLFVEHDGGQRWRDTAYETKEQREDELLITGHDFVDAVL